MKKQHITAMVATDLIATFDTVDNGMMCEVLSNCFGVEKQAINLFRSYIENRGFEVIVGKERSATKTINYSVPQGSCAGPALLTCYANNLDMALDHRSADPLGYAETTPL